MRPRVSWRDTTPVCEAGGEGPSMTEKRREGEVGGAAGLAGAPDVVIITGLSGSGMSSATNAFEDLGYFCVDNLPLTLMPTFGRLVQPAEHNRPHIERAALVVDIREGRFLKEFPERLKELRASGL